MKTLPHWANLLPLLGATLAHYFGLGWLRAERATANLGECGHPSKPRLSTRERPEEPGDEWCPSHECWYTTGDECPDCRAETDDAEGFAKSNAFWAEFDALAIADREREDGWYLDLLLRSDHPSDPHSGWREGL